MSDDQMLKCLIAFILGYFLCKMIGNGFSVGGSSSTPSCKGKTGLISRMPVDSCMNQGDIMAASGGISMDNPKEAAAKCNQYYQPGGLFGFFMSDKICSRWNDGDRSSCFADIDCHV